MRASVRWALLLWVAAGAAGCVRNLRAEEAYLDTLRGDFEAHPFQTSLPEAKLRLLTLAQGGPDRSCAPCVFVDRCSAKTCQFRFGTSSGDEACLLATEEPYGVVHFKVTCGETWRVENTIRTVWQELEPGTFESADTKAQGALAAMTVQEAQSFSPRWGWTAGAFGTVGPTGYGMGVRGGVRRWHDPNLLSSALVDYEYTWYGIPPAPIAQSNAGHLLSALLRAEVAPWSAWSARTSLPSVSLYMLGGATWAVDADRFPGNGYGWRFGLGVHANNYTRRYGLPVFVEVHLVRLFFREFEVTNGRAVLGIGF